MTSPGLAVRAGQRAHLRLSVSTTALACALVLLASPALATGTGVSGGTGTTGTASGVTGGTGASTSGATADNGGAGGGSGSGGSAGQGVNGSGGGASTGLGIVASEGAGGLAEGGYGGGGGGGAYDGGSGGGGGGPGLSLLANGANTGAVTGGAGGVGGAGYDYGSSGGGGGAGGAGLYGGNISVTNSGLVTGGAGGGGGYGAVGGGNAGEGGAGVFGDGISLSNLAAGIIQGGLGGYGGYGGFGYGGAAGQGGAGVTGTNFSVLNAGTIVGGMGGAAATEEEGSANGGNGGPGVSGTGFSVTNSGLISGGAGGGTAYFGGTGGAGGAGVTGSGFMLTNTGTVIGGNGGPLNSAQFASGTAGPGGAGVLALGGSTITNGGTISGGLSGDGATLADAVDLTGGGNVLVLEAGYVFNGAVVTAGGDTLALGGTTNSSFNLSQAGADGSLSGFSDFAKTGSSTWTVSGTASFTSTSVEAGTLFVGDAADANTDLGGNMTVLSGGTLRGHGTIGGNLLNDGEVWPGGSIGTLTVDGNYTQNAAGTLAIEVAPAANDELNITGSASLAGKLAVQVDDGAYTVGTKYDIVHTGAGVTGTFSGTTYSQAFATYITPVVDYTGSDVYLELTATQTASSAPAFSTGDLYVASNFIQDKALAGMAEAPLGTDRGYWLHGLGEVGSANGHDIADGGFVLGRGFAATPDLTLGGAFANGYTTTTQDGSHVGGTAIGGLAYALYRPGNLTLAVSGGAGESRLASTRLLAAVHLAGTAAGTGTYETAALLLRYRVGGPVWSVTPYGGATYVHTNTAAANEAGAGILNLRYSRMETSLGLMQAGVDAAYTLPVALGELSLWARLGAEGTLGSPHVRVTETLGTEAEPVTALAAPLGAFTPGLGLTLQGHGPWRLSAAWTGEFGSAASVQGFTLEGRYIW
jgi:hypothetical protein